MTRGVSPHKLQSSSPPGVKFAQFGNIFPLCSFNHVLKSQRAFPGCLPQMASLGRDSRCDGTTRSLSRRTGPSSLITIDELSVFLSQVLLGTRFGSTTFCQVLERKKKGDVGEKRRRRRRKNKKRSKNYPNIVSYKTLLVIERGHQNPSFLASHVKVHSHNIQKVAAQTLPSSSSHQQTCYQTIPRVSAGVTSARNHSFD